MTYASSFLLLYLPNLIGFFVPAAWLWRRTERDPQKIFRFHEALRLTLINLFLFLPLQAAALAWFYRPRLTTTWWQELAAFAASFVLAELWFYAVHRMFHLPLFFNRVHYLHHQAHRPHVIHSGYQHPFEFLTATMGTCFIGPMLVPMHPWTAGLWLLWMMAAGTLAHGGYFPRYLRWFRPHDHHHKYIRQNYGFLFLDLILKTTYRLKKGRGIAGGSSAR